MVVGGSLANFPQHHGLAPPLAVKVALNEEGHWTVEIKHGLCIVNHHRQMVTVLRMQPETEGTGECFHVPSGGLLDLPLNDIPLRFWLGSSQWTRGVAAANHAKGPEVLESDHSFAWGGPSLGSSSWHGAPLLVNFAGSDGCSGQEVLAVWPPITLANMLPHQLVLCPPERAQWATIVVEPGSSMAVPVGLHGGEVANLGAGLASSVDAFSTIPLLCPPLGEGEEMPVDPPSGRDVAYVMAPGNSADIGVPFTSAEGHREILPCVLSTNPLERGPGLQLSLLPQTLIVNKLPYPASIHVRAGNYCLL